MKKNKPASDGDIREEYKRSDFETLERGKYHARVQESSNVIILDDDLAEVFPNSAAVNRALHILVEAARKTPGLPK